MTEPTITPAMVREGARALDLWSDESLREEIDAHRMAELVITAALKVASEDESRLRALLKRWLEECAAMGEGPRSMLTQDTLDALGRLAFDEVRDG